MPKYKLITSVLLIFTKLVIIGQSVNIDGENLAWEGRFNAGLNNDGYSFEIGAGYFYSSYLGVKVGLGCAAEIQEFEDWNNDDYYYSYYNDYTIRFIFNPSIVIRSPRIIHWRQQNAGFYLFTEPGMIFSPGASGSHNAKYVCWDFKSGLNLQVDRFIFTIGYGISNFSLYSGSPENHWGIPDKTEYLTHTAYVGGAIKF